MTEKEIAELRRRLKPEKCNIGKIRGCMVGENKEILSRFSLSAALLNESEAEQIFSLFRKALSGKAGRNLHDLSFSTAQVGHSDEHTMLMALRDSALCDDDAVEKLYGKLTEALTVDYSYLILLAEDVYDLISYRRDGSDAGSTGVFRYCMGCVCPLKLTKTVLHYTAKDTAFELLGADSAVCPPELGFLFPAFDDRTANIYGSLFYTRDPNADYSVLTDRFFGCSLPMPQNEQKAVFRELLADTVGKACDLDMVEQLHTQVETMLEEHKQSRDPEPLLLSAGAVRQVLLDCGMPEAQSDTFEKSFTDAYGADAEIQPEILAEPKKYCVETPEVQIKLDPAHKELLQTRVIDGRKYILIAADGGVSVNGITVHIE